MCLIVKGDIRITKRNKTVYKVFYDYDGTLASPYRGMEYTLDRVYKMKAIKIVRSNPYNRSEKRINRGYHAYTTLFMAERHHTFDVKCVYRAIIPAGSQYAVSDTNEIVSNQIIIKDKVLRVRKALRLPSTYV